MNAIQVCTVSRGKFLKASICLQKSRIKNKGKPQIEVEIWRWVRVGNPNPDMVVSAEMCQECLKLHAFRPEWNRNQHYPALEQRTI